MKQYRRGLVGGGRKVCGMTFSHVRVQAVFPLA